MHSGDPGANASARPATTWGAAACPAPQARTSTQTVALALDLSGIYLESPCEALDVRAQPGLALGVKRAEPAAPSFLPPRAL